MNLLGVPEASDRNAASRRYAGSERRIATECRPPERRPTERRPQHPCSRAEQALALCRQHDISTALLTELSLSCGSGQIYDGSFTRQSISASGVTTALLQQHGVKVFNQYQLDEALSYITIQLPT